MMYKVHVTPEQIEFSRNMMSDIMMMNSGKKQQPLDVEKVIFNQDATIVYFTDGTKTVVKRQSGDAWNKEAGMMAAFSKKLFGNDNTFNKIINRYCSPYYHEDERVQNALEKLAKNMRKFIETEDSRVEYENKKERQKEYEAICEELRSWEHDDKERYEELLAMKNSIKAEMSLFDSIYMTGDYIVKSFIFEYCIWELPTYAKEFLKLAKKHFDVELTVVRLKDDKFKIIIREEDEDEVQEQLEQNQNE